MYVPLKTSPERLWYVHLNVPELAKEGMQDGLHVLEISYHLGITTIADVPTSGKQYCACTTAFLLSERNPLTLSAILLYLKTGRNIKQGYICSQAGINHIYVYREKEKEIDYLDKLCLIHEAPRGFLKTNCFYQLLGLEWSKH